MRSRPSMQAFLPAAVLWALLCTACGGDAPTARPASEPALTEARAAALRAEILPSAAERAWEEIDWIPTYAGGLQEGARQGKPVMLWVMNGHPLGCT